MADTANRRKGKQQVDKAPHQGAAVHADCFSGHGGIVPYISLPLVRAGAECNEAGGIVITLIPSVFAYGKTTFLAGDGTPLVTYGDIPLTGGPLP